MHFFANLYSAFNAQFQMALPSLWAVLNAISAPLIALVTLYLVIYGYMLMMGHIQELMGETMRRVMRLAIIVGLVTNYQTFDDNIGRLVTVEVPDWINGFVGSGTSSSPKGLVGIADSLFSKAASESQRVLDSAGVDMEGFFKAVTAILILVVGAMTSVTIFVQVVLVMATLKLVVLMGPIFISFGLFEKTSDLLIGWTRQIAHGLVELLFYAVAGKIALNMIGNAESYAGYSGKDLVLAAFGALLGLLVSVVLFFKIPGLASGITGGHQGLTLGQLVAQRALGFAARQAGLVTAAGLGAGQAVTWRGIRGGAWAAGAATGALQGAWTAHRRLGKP